MLLFPQGGRRPKLEHVCLSLASLSNQESQTLGKRTVNLVQLIPKTRTEDNSAEPICKVLLVTLLSHKKRSFGEKKSQSWMLFLSQGMMP